MELMELRADLEERFKTGRMQENLIAEFFFDKSIDKCLKKCYKYRGAFFEKDTFGEVSKWS